MSLFSWLWHYLAGSDDSPPERRRAPDAATETATAVIDPPAEEAEVEVADDGDEPQEGDWWVPRKVESDGRTVSESEQRVFQDLYARLTRVLDDPNLELPRLPRVTDRALTLLRGAETDYRELAEVIEQDPALTAEVLRIANSVAYRGISEIRRLEAAFARLGQRALRSVLLGATVRSISITLGGGHRTLGEGIWRRCVASGAITAIMAERHGVDPKDGLLAGLLHDIGHFVVLTVAHDYQRRTGVRVPREVFDRLSAEWHEHVGLRLATAWNLPDPLPALISAHHNMPGPDDPLAKLRLLVMFSDATCALLRYSPYQPIDLFSLPCVQALGLKNDAPTRRFLRELPQHIETRLDPV